MDARLTELLAEVVPAGLARVEDDDGVRLAGSRGGRAVEIGAEGGAMVTRVGAPVPDLQALGNAAGTFVVDAGAPPAAAAVLAALPAVGPVWRDVRVHGGAGGLVAVRRSGASGYRYDLWLLERLAEALCDRS
ncbi:hypothetical protein [Dactylosporangium darangshiense]|uniref:Uncharacterized protein n=1 Tax=Dactylosporangium darangshiense TaxID=579108 RepID=A0ABP8DL39_9ACTN